MTFRPGRSSAAPRVTGLRRQRVSFASSRERHGITPSEVAYLLRARGLRCWGCGRQGTELLGPDGTPWQVDHDHVLASTHPHEDSVGCRSCFRGMLCRPCNSALGFARDDPAMLRSLADYVERASERRPG